MNRINYFQTETNYFWCWRDDFDVVESWNGDTIAYKEHLDDVINQLATQGLPPFGSLLLAFTATNPKGKFIFAELFASLKEHLTIHKYFEEKKSKIFDSAFEFLENLSNVPAIYKVGNKRILLFKALFFECHGKLSLKESVSIAKVFKNHNKNHYPKNILSSRKSRTLTDFRVFEVLNNKYRSTKDIVKLISQIPEFEEAIEIKESTDANLESKDFFDALIENEKTFKIGALIKYLWAGLKLSFNNALPNQQPIGGVSDLGNKGNIDQLLISEYANSDMVFLSRLVNQEALYLNREKPPLNSDAKRIILIDVSLSNWGTPKIVEFAVMLALTKHPKNKMECEVYAIGNDFKKLDIDTIHQINESIQIIDANLSAANGLKAVLEMLQIENKKEVFLLTGTEALQQAAMQKVMNQNNQQINYCITHTADGAIDVYQHKNKKRKHQQHLKLPLKQLWKRKHQPNKDSQVYSIADYPILLKRPNNIWSICTTVASQHFIITKEKTLLLKRKANENKGWELVCENVIVASKICKVGVLKNGDIILLSYDVNTKHIVLFDIQTKEVKRIFFNPADFKNGGEFVFCKNSFFYLGNSKTTWLIQLDGKYFIHKGPKIWETLTNIYQNTAEEVIKTNRYIYRSSILKNVRKVAINESHNIVFNNHKLQIANYQYIKLSHSTKKITSVLAEQISHNCFEFADGSQVIIKPVGLFILISSNSSIAPIFIPAVLDTAIGIATKDTFAGNAYYYKEPNLVDLGTNIDPPKAKHQSISDAFNQAPKATGKINRADFFTLHIQPFINTILDYAI